MTPELYILTGPTAVGKTALSLEWAETHNAEILSCDALLFYRGMDIGTAKPDASALNRVRHHGIDLCPANRSFSIAEYVQYSETVVSDVFSRGKNLLITGGSGFYLKSFFEPVVDSIKIPDEVCHLLDKLEKETGFKGLVAKLQEINPYGLDNLDLDNPRRVRRALERCLASGKSVVTLKKAFQRQSTPFDNVKKRVCLLLRDRESLKIRIRERVQSMIAAGLINEVRRLIGLGIKENPTAARAIGYREVIAYLDSASDRSSQKINELQELISIHTNQLVRKQMTWFRHQLPTHSEVWLDDLKKVEVGNLFNHQ